MPHRRREELRDWEQAYNKSRKQVRARVEHVFARMKGWKILRDCRLKGDGVHHAMLGIARLHNLALPDRRASRARGTRVQPTLKINCGTALRRGQSPIAARCTCFGTAGPPVP